MLKCTYETNEVKKKSSRKPRRKQVAQILGAIEMQNTSIATVNDEQSNWASDFCSPCHSNEKQMFNNSQLSDTTEQ